MSTLVLFCHIDSLSEFEKKFIAINETNQTSVIGAFLTGKAPTASPVTKTPDINWNSIVFIKDVGQIYYNRKFYADSSNLENQINDLCSYSKENLLLNTNKGTSEWHMTYSIDGKMMEATRDIGNGTNCYYVTNYMDSNNPGYQIIYRDIPVGLLSANEEYVLSFSMICQSAGNSMCFNCDIGNTTATHTVCSSGWFYVTCGEEQRVKVKLKGAGTGVIKDDKIKLSIVPGQNPSWNSFAIWDVQLQKGNMATAYLPAENNPAILKTSISNVETKLNSVIEKIEQYFNEDHRTVPICAVVDVDTIDNMITVGSYDDGDYVFAHDTGKIYEIYNASDLTDFMEENPWNTYDGMYGTARTDTLFYYGGKFFTVDSQGKMSYSIYNIPFTPISLK